MPEQFPIVITVPPEGNGKRLDQFLAIHIQETSRARVQQLISEKKVLVDDAPAKASLRLRGAERIAILGTVQLAPLRAIAEEIPLDVVFEDDDLAVINKPAGMMVHAGAGATEAQRNRGTLVNALLHRFRKLSGMGGELRPGIVHRLDKATSGLIVVAKNDEAHRRLSAQFARREVKKKYIALVHGWLKQDKGTISRPISRDRAHRTKMTARKETGREAITHYLVKKRIDSHLGKFTLLELKIDTGRTHQIRVHLSTLGHPVVGDALYGAPRVLRGKNQSVDTLSRNFLHAASLKLQHPRTGEELSFSAQLPLELQEFLDRIDHVAAY
ncbi:MAG: RluA family pseudouridine synthase [Terriglobales bacterium]|jgi:23S rRNA pseudouridine1911/1915/1917 synthase|nr:RluA family pseudouridine synthase [Terriglobales bacterium]